MSLKILPKKVILEIAMSEMGMDHLSEILAVRTLLMYSFDYDVPIYFDDQAVGVDEKICIGEVFDNDGDFVDFKTADINEIEEVYGAKKIERASVYAIPDKGNIYVSVDTFSKDGMTYQVINNRGDKLTDVSINYKELYFKDDEFTAFNNGIESGDKQAIQPKIRDVPSGEMKALALIAREMADGVASYRTGNKVNASAVKNHILKLAKHYKKTDLGLKKLDDKINKVLGDLDLKDIVEP